MFKKFAKIFFLILVNFLFLFNFSFAEKVEDLKIDKYVNDFADMISAEKEIELNNLLYKHFASTSNQIIVVTIKNLNGDYIEHYSIKLAEKIKAGNDKKDNGIIFLVSKDDRKYRIEVGYGLEPIITDGVTNYILNNFVRPEFKNGNFDIGIENAITKIVDILEHNEETDFINNSQNLSKDSPLSIIFELLPFILFFGIIIFQWLAAILGRTKSWWLGGVIGFILGIITILFLTITFSILITFILSILGLIFDYFISKNYNWHKQNPIKRGPPNWWSGGSWGPGSSTWTSGGSDYTFRGGGGGFGGGGSSGDW